MLEDFRFLIETKEADAQDYKNFYTDLVLRREKFKIGLSATRHKFLRSLFEKAVCLSLFVKNRDP